jgi:carbon monoxide dehydrogenase subunit G
MEGTMPDLTIAIDIAAPPDRVWQVMRDVDRWHEWTASIARITRVDGARFAVGVQLLIEQPKLPRALWTVTEILPHGFVSVSTGPGFRVRARHVIEPAGLGSRATLSLEYTGLFGGLLGRLTRRITERYVQMEAAGLKARSEDPNFRVAP